MSDALEQLLAYKKLGTVVFDEQFHIVEADKRAQEIFVSIGPRLSKSNLLDFFPELIGSEEFIKQIIHQQKKRFLSGIYQSLHGR